MKSMLLLAIRATAPAQSPSFEAVSIMVVDHAEKVSAGD